MTCARLSRLEDAAEAGGPEPGVAKGDLCAVPAFELEGNFFEAAVIEGQLIFCPKHFYIGAVPAAGNGLFQVS